MPAPTQLSLYKGACLALGQAPILDLTEDVALRHALDVAWARDRVKACLQSGLWNHAARTSELNYEPSITPAYGPRYAFEIPSDYCTLIAISGEEYLREPLKQYKTEAGYWWSDVTPIYVTYVSDDNTYGRDYAKWPKNFEAFVEHDLAAEVAPTVAGIDVAKIIGLRRMKLREAKGTDAREEAAVEAPRGTWSRARTAGRQLDRSRSRY